MSRAGETLKPCPFCGEPGKIERLGGEGSPYRCVGCSKCGCDLHFYPTEEMAIATWNHRSEVLK